MALRAVIFDLFDTLVDLSMEGLSPFRALGQERRGTHPLLHAYVAGLCHGAGAAAPTLDHFVAALEDVDRQLRDPRLAEHLELSTLVRFDALRERLGIERETLAAELTELHMRALSAQVTPLAHHPALLAELGRRFRIGVCSNFSDATTAQRILAECELSASIDCTEISEQRGFRKPRPEIFRAVLDALQVAPEEAVHVGDRLEADVAGAKAAGLTAVWVTRRVPSVEAALEAYAGPKPDHSVRDLSELPPWLEERVGRAG